MLRALRRFFSDPAFARKKQFLRGLPLFHSLSDRQLGSLIQALHTRSYQEGEALFVEGDIGRALFIVESGRVELSKLDPEGRPQRLVALGAGDVFGEMALLEQLPRSASARALERSTLHLLYRTKLDELLDGEPAIGVAILRHLAQRLSSRLRRASHALVAGDERPEVIATL